MTTEYRNFTTDKLLARLESNRKHLQIAKDTFLFRDDVDTFRYNIETITAELVSRGVAV